MAARAETTGELDAQLDAVMRASRVLVGVLVRSLAELDGVVSLLQFRTLVVIATSQGANLGEVAARLGVHPSNATRVVDKLVTAGLVDRRDDPDDRRYVSLSLTPEGHAVVEQVMRHRRTALAHVVEAMPVTRRRTLASALQAFADAAGEDGEPVEEFVLGLPT